MSLMSIHLLNRRQLVYHFPFIGSTRGAGNIKMKRLWQRKVASNPTRLSDDLLAAARAAGDEHARVAMERALDNINDIVRYTMVLPQTNMAGLIQRALDELAEKGQVVDYVGNWWVEGNPYKGINCTLVSKTTPHLNGRPLKWELQFHTEQSGQLARANHNEYAILRDESQPLERRQRAFDSMASRFAAVPHPPGVDEIGTMVVIKRPSDEFETIRSILEAGGVKFKLEVEKPRYPEGLRELLDEGRIAHRQWNWARALEAFDEIVKQFSGDQSVWSRRGVALALLHSSQILVDIEHPQEAAKRLDMIVGMAEESDGVELEAGQARKLRKSLP